ncbi:MAG TPA: 6-phosphogluconolactonase, partial [Methylomirabilota bacterium]|nr:6-phosphogluconolactonase [Methylomirabilota bacterium]
MKRFEVVQYATDAELAQAATELWLKRVAEDRCRHGGHHVALSGGRIARNLFAAILHTTRAAPTELDTVHFFWADERCVPPDDPESNFGVAKTLLLDPLGIPQPRVHRIQGESPPDQAAAQASRNLAARVPVGPNGVPILD